MLSDSLFIEENDSKLMNLDADQKSESTKEKSDSYRISIQGRNVENTADKVQYISKHVNKEILVVAFSSIKDINIFLVCRIGHLLASKI